MNKVSGHCIKCGIWRDSLHHDHIIPKALGGSADISNIQLLCANCHQDKTAQDRKNIHWTHSAKSKANMSMAQKGRKKSVEHIEKLRRANQGKIMPLSVRGKISNALSGRVLSEDHKRKIGEAHRARSQQKRTQQNFLDFDWQGILQ